jgi:hypothetical protein
MAKFIPGVDTTVNSNEPLLEVQASRSAPLRAGRHDFQLVVSDNAGNLSAPVSVTVLVQDPSKPNAVVDFLREDGSRVYGPELVVPYAKPFRLTGDRSVDVNGSVTSWRWTLLSK